LRFVRDQGEAMALYTAICFYTSFLTPKTHMTRLDVYFKNGLNLDPSFDFKREATGRGEDFG